MIAAVCEVPRQEDEDEEEMDNVETTEQTENNESGTLNSNPESESEQITD